MVDALGSVDASGAEFVLSSSSAALRGLAAASRVSLPASASMLFSSSRCAGLISASAETVRSLP